MRSLTPLATVSTSGSSGIQLHFRRESGRLRAWSSDPDVREQAARHLLVHDPQTKVWRIPAVLAEEGRFDGQAAQPGYVLEPREGEAARARGSVLQETLREGTPLPPRGACETCNPLIPNSISQRGVFN